MCVCVCVCVCEASMHLLHPAQCKNKIKIRGGGGEEKKKKDCTSFRSTLEAAFAR